MTPRSRRMRRRKPWQAVILSILLPGLGHLYAGHPGKGLGRWALAMSTGLLGIALLLWFPFGALTLLVAVAAVLGVLMWIAVEAGLTARAAPSDFALRPYNHWLLYLALIVAGSLVPDVPKAFVEAYRIPSGAMEPTLQIGDFLFVTKLERHRTELSRGMMVVFESVDDRAMTVKRIVGLSGDTLSMRHNVLFLNGATVSEPYVFDAQAQMDHEDPMMQRWQVTHYVGADGDTYRPTLNNWGPLRVSPDSVFVLGDNRDNSYDSRYYGFVGRDRIRGRPLVIYFSYDRNGPWPLPFLTAIRGERIGQRLR